MRPLIAMAMVLVSLSCAAAGETTQATTTDNGRAILKPYVTRAYASAGAAGPDDQVYTKPVSATKVLKSKDGGYEVWYDPEKWAPHPPENKSVEFELGHATGNAGAMAIGERGEMPIEALKSVALKNAKETTPDAAIVSDKDITVNGTRVKAIRIDGTVENIPFSYYGYYWSGKGGTVQLIAYTGRHLFSGLSQDITDLLSGLVIITKP